MSSELLFVLGVFFGTTVGVLIGGLLASNRIDEAFSRGFERGKSVSVNSIK